MFTFIFGAVTVLLSLGVIGGIINLSREGAGFSELLAFVLLSFVVAVFWVILTTGQFIL
jgi:hypothetical protein